MLEQQGNALTFLAFYTENKLGKTGLSVTADIYEGTSAIFTGQSATEIGGGLYYYTLSSGNVDANANYVAIFKTSTTTVDQQWIPALWVVGRSWVARVDENVSAAKTLTTGERTSIAAAILNTLTSGLTTVGSIGKKLADWVLGTDNRVLLSANAQTGVTIPTVTTAGLSAGTITDIADEVVAGIGSGITLADGSITEHTFGDGAISSRVITAAAAAAAANVASGNVAARRGDTISSLALTTTAHDWDSNKRMRLLLKSRGYSNELDTEAYLGILLTYGGAVGDGLYLLNQAPRSDAGDLAEGSLVRSSSTQTLVNIKASAYAQLVPLVYAYEIQVAETDGSSVVTIAAGTWTVTADIIRATS
jgi:hypothetical protein